MVNYPSRLSLACVPTPFHCLERLSARLNGPRIWIKRDDLTGCVSSGNKVRKLEFILAQAVTSGCDTLITAGGTQSNHCRAVAISGAQLGLKVHLLLRSDVDADPVGNLFIDLLSGATINHYTPEEYSNLESLFAHWSSHYLDLGATPWVIPVGGSNAAGLWGYIAVAEELKHDFQAANINPGIIIHATGSGGTQAGLIAGVKLHNLDLCVHGYAVCDNATYFDDKIRTDLATWKHEYSVDIDVDLLPVITNDKYLGPGYGRAGPEVFDTIRMLAAEEGVILDPVYSGKAFYGMLEEIKSGRYANEKDIVFLHTGGIFGLLAQQQQLQF